MAANEFDLIGLLEETLLPGEERAFAPPAIDPGTVAALEARIGAKVVAVAIASGVELPTLVTARWGTECKVVAASEGGVTLRGERRIRVLSARGRESPYLAVCEPAVDEAAGAAGLGPLIAGAHALFAALEAGAVPERTDWPERLRTALPPVLRALASEEELRDALRLPADEALQAVAKTLAARTEGHRGSCALEAMMRAIAEKPELPAPLRQRLWSQVVEVQKRLDVFDPQAAGGGEGDDLGRLQRRLQQAGLPRQARETAKRELRLLRGMQSNHHDYSTYLAHLDFMARLPWHPETLPPIDLASVRAALEREHAGLEKAKRRVLEYLAVRSLGGDSASVVLCLAGPPGVGKTSIARAIAGALGRKFVRIPLGGVHDECELRGHRTTFTAAAPGRILAGLARAGSAAAVVLLDEIDKIGSDTGRSPSAALLEVLDPEQNRHFHDNYLGVPYDLSHVLFLCTANDLGAIDPTLRDRLELIELEGYTLAEKSAIVRRHLLPRLREGHGLPGELTVGDGAVRMMIEGHTREAGVRQLQRALAAIHRARALALAEGRAQGNPGGDDGARAITEAEVTEVLGPPRQVVHLVPGALPVGVAAGLSVGADGGAVLFIEVGRIPGKGELRLTGRLGEVMRETAHAALAHLKIDPARYGATAERLECDFHVHVPEAATAKDGPSAGAALFAAFLSAATDIPLRADVALTGEATLTGRVLPVGGVRAKVLAAERAGVTRVIVPEANRADVPSDVRVEIVFASDLGDVVRALFTRSPLSDAAPPAHPAGATAPETNPQANRRGHGRTAP
ncbi:MAG: AAA family ATPase [Myxococcales bacterium]|nr:AAA family ATPase [Myxococcales bacterium]